ncbi:FtsZ/tubulin family protein [Halorussus amylolyticus]|uniref:hypothetical protein n=1 Tax=Halorussus amylolyticus TaxID=1126242 RepID=UPI0010435E16|nr:hypothetical protein [Halorussus amylolyticus]
MSQKADTYTRWTVIASGEGGGRIASQFFTRSDNPGIDDRILVMNTNRADIRNTISRMETHLDDGEDPWANHALEFGSQQGAGNFFVMGQEAAREDLDRIVGSMSQVGTATDAFLHTATLGGGTGNGSIPYIIDQFKSGLDSDAHEGWMDSTIHTALAVWPYYYEAPQRQFNAVCGLSRLLRSSDGSQNADMVLLAANSHLSDDETTGTDYSEVNDQIISAIDLMIGAGRETRGVIDVQDYVTVPSQIGAYHFTPAVATDLNGDLFEMEYMFDKAAENAFVPMDVGTSRVTYAVVRAPESMIQNGDITEPDVQNAFNDWKRKHGLLGASGMTSLTPKQERGTDVDVLLLLGGFDLDPLLDHSWEEYEEYKESLQSGRSLGNGQLSATELGRIEENLTEYIEINEG